MNNAVGHTIKHPDDVFDVTCQECIADKPVIVLQASVYDDLDARGLLNRDTYTYIRQEKLR